jgi:hypothetical protein
MISREETLILFDKDLKEEHFIRKIQIEGQAKEFGFLVPVPSLPKVDEIKVDVFKALKDEYERQRPIVNRYTLFNEEGTYRHSDLDGMIGGMSKGRTAAPEAVEVIEEKQLGDFKVRVLKAQDSSGLQKWIDEHAYKTKPEMFAYLDHYVKKQFYFVVFNFRASEGDPSLAQTSQTIRLIFNTDRAFYPFKEPVEKDLTELTDQEFFEQDRDFRLSVIQKGMASARFLDEENSMGAKSNPLEKLQNFFQQNFNLRFASKVLHQHKIFQELGFNSEKEDFVLTQFQYLHKYRPPYDLTFDSIENFEAVLPPDKVVWHRVGFYFIIFIPLLIFCFYKFRKKKCCT